MLKGDNGSPLAPKGNNQNRNIAVFILIAAQRLDGRGVFYILNR